MIDNAQIRYDADILGAQIKCDADISFPHVVMCDVWSQILVFCVGVDVGCRPYRQPRPRRGAKICVLVN